MIWGRNKSSGVLTVVLSVTVVLGLGSLTATAQTYVGMPDLKQQGFGFALPKQGYAYCGPTAVANVLLWMDDHRMRERYRSHASPLRVANRERTFEVDAAGRLIRRLGEYMNTDVDNGTPPAQLLSGLNRYLQENGHRDCAVSYHGIRPVKRGDKRVKGPPSLRELYRTVKQGSFAVLNLGWYKEINGRLVRIGGHWVTFKGWKHENGKRLLVVHDPANRPYWKPAAIALRLQRIKAGEIMDRVDNWTYNAKGFHVLHGPIARAKGSDYALLEGIVFIEPHRKGTLAYHREGGLHFSMP